MMFGIILMSLVAMSTAGFVLGMIWFGDRPTSKPNLNFRIGMVNGYEMRISERCVNSFKACGISLAIILMIVAVNMLI